MALRIVYGDITKMNVDVIVNAANRLLIAGGGVDGAIHEAAGNELQKECSTLGGCKVGEAKYTLGYNLPAKYVIHTVGPIWYGGFFDERSMLMNCYLNSLKIAKTLNAKSIAFPLISTGSYGYPVKDALEVAIEEAKQFLNENDIDIYIVVYNKASLPIDVQQYIDENNF